MARLMPIIANSYSLDKGGMDIDLSTERPQWILSAYGPGRDAPAQLFGGSEREQSFEEMRLRHYEASAAGRPQQAVRHQISGRVARQVFNPAIPDIRSTRDDSASRGANAAGS